MITKLIGEGTVISSKAINTDHATSLPGRDVIIEQNPEDSGDRIWVLDSIQYSYAQDKSAGTLAAPIAGGITIKLDEKVKFDADIPDFTGVLALHIPSQTDKVISVTLKAGGQNVIGKLNVQWHLEPV